MTESLSSDVTSFDRECAKLFLTIAYDTKCFIAETTVLSRNIIKEYLLISNRMFPLFCIMRYQYTRL